MNNKVKLPLRRVLEINRAVELVGTIDDLAHNETYWLGRLGDFCSSSVKNYQKSNQKIWKEAQRKQKPLQDSLEAITDKKSKEALDLIEQINTISEEASERVENLLDQDEEINMPEFKSSSFKAEEDVTRVFEIDEKDEKGEPKRRKVEIKVKKGQSLVPVAFYKLMGEYIKE